MMDYFNKIECLAGLIQGEYKEAASVEVRGIYSGGQIRVDFHNSYGASVVLHEFSYGNEQGLFELAVLCKREGQWDLSYTTGIAEDVIGRLTELDVARVLYKISNLEEDMSMTPTGFPPNTTYEKFACSSTTRCPPEESADSPLNVPEDMTLWVAANRYYIGRTTNAVEDWVFLLTKKWPTLPAEVHGVIRQDVEEAFKRDDVARVMGYAVKPLGHDCDRRTWELVRELWGGAGYRCKK